MTNVTLLDMGVNKVVSQSLVQHKIRDGPSDRKQTLDSSFSKAKAEAIYIVDFGKITEVKSLHWFILKKFRNLAHGHIYY